MIGGGLVGVESGLHLANQGKQVTVLELMDDYVRDARGTYRLGVENAVKESGMNIITGAKTFEVADAGDGSGFCVTYEKDGENITIPADHVFYAVGMRPNERLYFELYDKTPYVSLVGDAKAPGKVDGAIHSGFFAALEV